MHSVYQPKFSPAQVGEITNIPPEQMRDWRRLGWIDNFGTEGENGRWAYNARDVAALWIAGRLSVSMKLEDALRSAYSAAPAVLANIMRLGTGQAKMGNRYVAQFNTGYTEDGVVYGSSIRSGRGSGGYGYSWRDDGPSS